MLKLEKFEQKSLNPIEERSVKGGGKETGASTRAGVSYACDWEDGCELRCYTIDGKIDVYYCV